ncbi:LruC domain-containing protein [bacterium]|nr:LruC domain-containing protein [bacterium]
MHSVGTMRLWLLLVLTMLALASCGGGGASAPDPQDTDKPGQGSGNLPGQQKPDPVGGGPEWLLSPVGDVDAVNAPLGTNPAYDMQLLGGEVTGNEPARTSSVLVGPAIGDFNPLGIVMMHDGEAPNWSLTSNTFTEGEPVDLYMKYEVPATDFLLDRRWISAKINLDLTEANISHPTANIYIVKLDWNIPMGTKGQSGVFNYTLKHEDVTKPSPNFNYNIVGTVAVTTSRYPVSGDAQIAWEDLLVNSDYDYNDFVARMNIKEWRRDSDDALLQIDFVVKALARGAGYGADWQFNISNAFPGAKVTASVKQFKKNGTLRHQTIWKSSNGTDLPVFTPTSEALPAPNGTWATNTVSGTPYVEGDYAQVTIVFDQPFTGTALPMPYNPLLKVTANSGQVYSIGIWKTKGDTVDTQGNPLVDDQGRPLAFVVPYTYAWPLEQEPAWNAYSGYWAWANWINNTGSQPNSYWYQQAPSTPSKAYSRGKFTGTGKDYNQQDAGNHDGDD